MAFEWFIKKGCVRLCQQCCSDSNSLPPETIEMVNAVKRDTSTLDRDASNGTRCVDTQVDIKLSEISSEFIDLHEPNGEEPTAKMFVRNRSSRMGVSFVPYSQNELR